MPVPDPETDPAILALERDEAYAAVQHHEQLRVQAEKAEEQQILRRRLLMPKAYAFSFFAKEIASYRVIPGDPEELIKRLEHRITQAKDEIEHLAPPGSRSRRIIESGLDAARTE